MNPEPSVKAGYVYAVITLLIWSGFVIVSRHGSQGVLNPFDIAALRISTAALVLSPWWIPRLFKPALRQLKVYQSLTFALLAGILYPLIAYTGFIYAPASHGAVLISGMLPFFTSLLAFFMLGERPNTMRLMGLALILSGVCTLFGANLMGASVDTATALRGDCILLTASVMWSLFTVLLKRWQVRAFDVTLGVSAVSALIYLPIYFLFLPKHITAAPLDQIGLQAFFQGFVVVCCAMWTYAKAAEILGAVKVVIMMSAVPVVGTLLAVPILGEVLTPGIALGAAITFLGALIGAMARPAGKPQPVAVSH
uniref:EamA domain-containing protein n=1 Tax=uncultured bacterium UPO53 TaxID=1776978 RepID=A0A126SYG3_9BACT|nr:hypothetical protein PSPA7_1522 [uncultured bacterium UPO53]